MRYALTFDQQRKLIRFRRQMLNQVKRLLGIEPNSAQIKSLDWVLPGKLAVAGFPRSGDAIELLKANIKVVLTLCSESEATLPEDIAHNFQCLRLVLPDRYYTTELTAELLGQAVGIIREHIQNNLPIYVHCLAGIERSPTVCIAYLCKYHNMELWEALNWLKQVHPASQPSPSELRAIREFLQQA